MTELSPHRMSLWERALALALTFAERWIVDALPRGRRRRLREAVDRAQAKLHARVHLNHDVRL